MSWQIVPNRKSSWYEIVLEYAIVVENGKKRCLCCDLEEV